MLLFKLFAVYFLYHLNTRAVVSMEVYNYRFRIDDLCNLYLTLYNFHKTLGQVLLSTNLSLLSPGPDFSTLGPEFYRSSPGPDFVKPV